MSASFFRGKVIFKYRILRIFGFCDACFLFKRRLFYIIMLHVQKLCRIRRICGGGEEEEGDTRHETHETLVCVVDVVTVVERMCCLHVVSFV